jgi:hypothetical protein
MVAEHRVDAVSSFQLRELTAAFFDVGRVEVEDVAGDDDEVGLQPVDALHERRQPFRLEQRPDVEIGDVRDTKGLEVRQDAGEGHREAVDPHAEVAHGRTPGDRSEAQRHGRPAEPEVDLRGRAVAPGRAGEGGDEEPCREEDAAHERADAAEDPGAAQHANQPARADPTSDPRKHPPVERADPRQAEHPSG